MTLERINAAKIIIVDPRPVDYAVLNAAAEACGMSSHALSDGQAALRLAPYDGPRLWIVNVRLPDMSGLDLVELLRRGTADTSIFVVDDEYSAAHERRALSAGATIYLCKPPLATWVHSWRPAMANMPPLTGGGRILREPMRRTHEPSQC